LQVQACVVVPLAGCLFKPTASKLGMIVKFPP
jgi:hypothetical protein